MSIVNKIAIGSLFVFSTGLVSTGVLAETITFGDNENCLSGLQGDQFIEGGFVVDGVKGTTSADGLTRKIVGYASTYSTDCDTIDSLSQRIWITNDYGNGIYVIDSSNVTSATNTSFIDYTLVYSGARVRNDNAIPAQKSNYPHCLIVGRNATHNGISVSTDGWVVHTSSYRNRCNLTSGEINSTVGGGVVDTGGPDDDDTED